MELLNLINNSNIKEYIQLKTILESTPYNLKIKEDNSYPNLFLICGQETSDYSLKIVNECNGIIMDKNTLKIVCYTFDKSPEQDTLSPELNTENGNLYYEPLYEGSLMRIYYFENEWIISTKKCIDPSKSKWISNKSFMELFKEAINVQNPNIFDHLNKDYCYSFILAHPENNVIMRCYYPQIFHISTRDMTTLKEINVELPLIPRIERVPFNMSFEELNNYLENDRSLENEGYMLIDTNYNRQKFRKRHYNYLRDLWGNSNNRFFRYLELRKDFAKLSGEYFLYFPDDHTSFIEYEENLNIMAQNILYIYCEKHVHKRDIKIPYYYAKFIYKLHGDFIKSKIYTDYDKIRNELWLLEPKKLCFMYNEYVKSLNIVQMEC
jgi:hypothetical protein